MKTFVFAALASVAALGFAAPALAQNGYVTSYCATLSYDDHFASDGYPLDTAAQVIRQDRANVHEFGVSDPGDEYESVFGNKDYRAWLEGMLNGTMDSYTANEVLYGYPDVCVEVYEHYVQVHLQ